MTALLTTNQREFFQPEDMPECDEYMAKAAAMGEYTGELLFRQNPRLYRVCAALLGHGMGIRKVARTTGLNIRSVMAVRDREGETIATVKQHLSRTLLNVGTLAAEAVQESLESGKPITPKERKDLMIAAGIATANGLLTAGEATIRIDVRRQEPSHEDFNRYLASLRPATGLGGENPEQIAAPGMVEIGQDAAGMAQDGGKQGKVEAQTTGPVEQGPALIEAHEEEQKEA